MISGYQEALFFPQITAPWEVVGFRHGAVPLWRIASQKAKMTSGGSQHTQGIRSRG